jgi:hypothetical protein
MKKRKRKQNNRNFSSKTASHANVLGYSAREILHFALFLLIAALVASYFTHTKSILTRQDPTFSLNLLVNGDAPTPFQYRYLVPWLMKKTMIFIQLSSLRKMITVKEVIQFFEILPTFLLLVGFRYYLSFFIKQAEACSVLAFSILIPLSSNYMLARMIDVPMSGNFYMPLYFPYDIPSVMFFTFGLILIYKRKWVPYYLLFALATFNRETTCFLTMVYALVAYGRDKNSTIAVHIAVQAAIWLAIKLYLKALFAANTGTAFDINIFKSFIYFTEPYFYKQMLSNLAGIWLIVALFYGRIEDRFLRRSVIVAIPFYAGMMFVGNLYELRIFAELAPVLTPAAIVIIKDLLTEEEFNEG